MFIILLRQMPFNLLLKIISAQQLPRPKDSLGREIEKTNLDPYVEVSLHIPEWTQPPFIPPVPARRGRGTVYSSSTGASSAISSTPRMVSYRTISVKNNCFNPVWEEQFSLPFDLVGDMLDLVFVRFAVKREGADVEGPLAVYCASLGSLNMGKRTF